LKARIVKILFKIDVCRTNVVFVKLIRITQGFDFEIIEVCYAMQMEKVIFIVLSSDT